MDFKHTPEEARKLWVDALRSGEYRQSSYALCTLKSGDVYGLCCLGVACLAFEGSEHQLEHKDEDGIRLFGGSKYALPLIVQDWLGLKSSDGSYRDGEWQGVLWKDNDHRRKTFQEIADIIESNPPGLFVEA